MANSSPRRIPKYRLHKSSGQALVELGSKRYYLGAHGTPESHKRYADLLERWEAAGRQPIHSEPDITIVELIERFWTHAENYYLRADGTPAGELGAYRQALRPLRRLFANELASNFGPRSLIAVRQVMINEGWARTSINRQVSRLRHVFRWAAAQELVSESVWRSLQAVEGLRRGRSAAREPDPVRAVPEPFIIAIEPYVSSQVWALVMLQLRTAARAGELLVMRPIDLDTSGTVWRYSPVQHKNAHRGHERTIYLGPMAQAIVEPFLARPVESYLFSPIEAESDRRAVMHELRKTPLHYGNRPGSNRKRRPEWKPGDHYTINSYRRAIARGIVAANAAGDVAGEIPMWTPHQLRHTAATMLRKEFDLETARIILGHRSANTTEIYAELDRAKGEQAIARFG